MRNTKLSIMDRIEILLDRFMEIIEMVLPILCTIILLWLVIQIIQRG